MRKIHKQLDSRFEMVSLIIGVKNRPRPVIPFHLHQNAYEDRSIHGQVLNYEELSSGN